MFWEWPQRQRLWCSNGNHPFGALLVDADGNVVLEAENTVVTERDCTGHTESNLMRMANARFNPEFLKRRTLYTSTEPCAMCAGAIYWGNVRRVVFALIEEELHRVGRTPENPTLALPCREVFVRGQQEIEVSGASPRTGSGCARRLLGHKAIAAGSRPAQPLADSGPEVRYSARWSAWDWAKVRAHACKSRA